MAFPIVDRSRMMWYRSSICLLVALFAAGCGGGVGEGPRAAAVPEKQTRPDTDKRAEGPQKKDGSSPPPKQGAPPPVVYSSRDLARILDLSALPALPGTEPGKKSAAAASAQVPGTVSDVSAFYRKTLSASGWEPVPVQDTNGTDEYASLRFGKNGHLVSLTVSKFSVSKDKGPQTLVDMRFHGNLDTRTLPMPVANQVLFSSQTVTSYLTENTVPEATSWVQKALAAEGWQKFTALSGDKAETGANRTLTFRKQGYALTIFIGVHPLQKKTYLQYQVAALGHELPTPPEATKVQFNDARWEMACEVPGDWKGAADFYQKAMPALGYRPLPGEDPQPTYWNLRFGTDTGDLIMVQVSSKDRQTTQVSIHGVPAAVLAAIRERDERKTPPKK
jgi:hypothetical protein